jgi:hypothetical protein
MWRPFVVTDTSYANACIYGMQPGESSRYSDGYGLDYRGVGVRVPVGSRMFSSPSSSRPAVRTIHPSRVKCPVCEAGNSLPTSAEVKKTWIYTYSH